MNLNIVMLGLSITSSWGNGHATTYRALARALARRGHTVTFLERDTPWYRDNRDLAEAPYCSIRLYNELREIPRRFGPLIRDANMVILGSYVPDGIAIGDWVTTHAHGVTAFYDIDTPVTLAGLETRQLSYLTPTLIPRFDLYLSFSGGPALTLVQERYASPMVRPLYCSAECDTATSGGPSPRWALGYLGTYSDDRQPQVEQLMFEPARHHPELAFVVAGSKYPEELNWPSNVTRIAHVAPNAHPAFYRAQRFTLNVTRADMRALGFSPSVRLFEAAACGVPVISDRWPGLETLFTPSSEILVADTARDVIAILNDMSEDRRRELAAKARARLRKEHTPDHRVRQLEQYYLEAASHRRPRTPDALAAAEV